MTTPLKDDTVYIAGDRFVCSSIRCAGSTAVASGIDIDGHRLIPTTDDDAREWASYDLGPLTCECGRVTHHHPERTDT